MLLLYIALLVRVGKIARKCPSRFSTLLVMGCALMLVTQAFIHMLISVNMFPVTGQPLPLISRGGTSVIISCMYIGVILNVSYSVGEGEAQDENIQIGQLEIRDPSESDSDGAEEKVVLSM